MWRIAFMLMVVFTVRAFGEEKLLQKIQWEKAPEGAEMVASTQPAAAGKAMLKVMGEEGGKTVTLSKIEKPGIASSQWAILGEVKYENVVGNGYLELWNYFDDGGMFFSRTLGNGGVMGKLKGTHDWRKFILPFNSKEGYYPKALVFNVTLPGEGTIWVRDVRLVEYPQTAADKSGATTNKADGAGGPWWDERQGGLIGGIAGGTLGTFGTLVGILAAMGRARNAVLAVVWTMIITGVMMLGAGLFALAMGQGWAVYYPLLLCGLIATAVAGGMLPGIKKKYEEREMRKVGVMDV